MNFFDPTTVDGMHAATVAANDWLTLGSSTSDAGRSLNPACLITLGDKASLSGF